MFSFLQARTHCQDSNQQPTAFIRPLCCLSSDLFGRKFALKHTTSTAASYTVACTFCACTRSGGASLMPVIQNMKTGNEGTECIEKQSTHHRVPTVGPVCFRFYMPILSSQKKFFCELRKEKKLFKSAGHKK